eukprot:8945363-Ditylum_brightwellii.AAC.1
MGHFLISMKHTISKANAKSGDSLDKGKQCMTFNVYTKYCEILIAGEGDDYIYAHCFLTLEWNLLSCSDNCFAMYLCHVQWTDNCLLLYFGTSQCDQIGEKLGEPWHVYLNPKYPSLCSVLAMAKDSFHTNLS